MSKRYPLAKWTLPDVVNPPDTVCFTIEVPNNIYHIAAFRGALYNLTSARFWQDDLAHTALEVAAVWQDVFDNIRRCSDEIALNQGITLEDFMSQQIRIKPDDPCIIQMWCIDDWVDWYDPRSCIPGTIEQPTNGEGIEPGECREWDVSLRGNEKWLLPAVVSEGDAIEITGASGAWNDGGVGWNCVNGFTYALGACVSAENPEGTDPLQTTNHMRLIMNIDGSWFDAYNNLISVPGGISAEQVYFQANDADLTNNSGTVSFHVKLCRFEQALSPITITYSDGSGITELDQSGGQTSWLVTMTAENVGGTNGYSVNVSFSEQVKITVQQQFGYVNRCSACLFSTIAIGGTQQCSLSKPTYSNLTQMTPACQGDVYIAVTGNETTATPFSVQLLIEKV